MSFFSLLASQAPGDTDLPQANWFCNRPDLVYIYTMLNGGLSSPLCFASRAPSEVTSDVSQVPKSQQSAQAEMSTEEAVAKYLVQAWV